MKIIIAFTAFILTLSVGITTTFAGHSTSSKPIYCVQQVGSGGAFVIDNENFTARDGNCPDVKVGDKVRFVHSGPHQLCISAVFVNLNSGHLCSVWCY